MQLKLWRVLALCLGVQFGLNVNACLWAGQLSVCAGLQLQGLISVPSDGGLELSPKG